MKIGIITDFNETFLKTFQIKKEYNIRGKKLNLLANEIHLHIDTEKIEESIKKIENTYETDRFEMHIAELEKYFNVEVTSIIANNQFLGILILFKDITQHKKDMEIIKENQEMLVEKERPTVNDKDMHDIAGDMKNWLVKMRGQLSYMSEVITTVKGQAVNLSGDDMIEFTIEELFSHTSILMKHELQNALINLNIENKVSNNTRI